MSADLIQKARLVAESCEEAYIGVLDEQGYPSVSTVSVVGREGFFELYFSTGTQGNKTLRLQKDGRASVCLHKGADNVTLVGDVRILTDQETKSRLWQDWFISHFPLGPTDPSYCILHFVPHRLSLWIDQTVGEFTVEQLLTVQSRCGLLCASCGFREPCSCGGCIETMGNPFHGQCPIAACCQEKGYQHCGQCGEMPCPPLKKYSLEDPEHGDKPAGSRLEMLRCWAQHNKCGVR